MASTAHGSSLCRCSMPSAPGARKVITYPFEDGELYAGGSTADVVSMLRECRAAGIVTTNFHPKNLLCTKGGIRLIDYGSDIRPYSERGFLSMVQRAWLTLRFHRREDLSELMRRALSGQMLPELEGWEALLAAIDPPSKREIIDDAVLDIVRPWKPDKALDFGCGHGRMAAELARGGTTVVAFDPDESLIHRWQDISQTGVAVAWRTGDPDKALACYVGTFDLVVCSLVLCVIGNEQEYLATIRHLATMLSPTGRFIIVICDPHATLAGDSTTQRRCVPASASSEQTFVWTKELPSGRQREDVHRPLERIIRDLADHGLAVERTTSTGGLSLDAMLPSMDNLFLIGSKRPSDGTVAPVRAASHCGTERQPVDVPVLCYHRVLPNDYHDSVSSMQRLRGTVVDLDVFKQHVHDIRRLFVPVTLVQYLRWLNGHENLPPHACLITFDDGHRDCLEYAMPELLADEMPCVIFATMCAAAGEDHLPVDGLYAALASARMDGRISDSEMRDWVNGDRKRMFVRATRDKQKQMLAESGLLGASLPHRMYLTEMELASLPRDIVSIGGHGERHELLAGRGVEWLRRELRRVRFWLERVNQARSQCPSVLAYPNGTHDPLTVAATIEAGFEAAFSVAPWQRGRSAHRWALRRSCIPNRMTAVTELADGKEVRL